MEGRTEETRRRSEEAKLELTLAKHDKAEARAWYCATERHAARQTSASCAGLPACRCQRCAGGASRECVMRDACLRVPDAVQEVEPSRGSTDERRAGPLWHSQRLNINMRRISSPVTNSHAHKAPRQRVLVSDFPAAQSLTRITAAPSPSSSVRCASCVGTGVAEAKVHDM